MPLYEYKCDNCGKLFEAMQKFADPYLTVHEACGGGPVHRLLSVPSLQFKGSGFYITDYAKGSGPGSPGKEQGAKEHAKDSGKQAESSGSSDKKSDSSAPPAPATVSSSSENKSPATTSSSSSDKK